MDGRADEAAYNTVGPAAIACAIADAVVGGSVGTTPAPVKPAPPPAPSGHHVWLQAKNGVGYVLEAVKDNEDNAGDGSPITYLSAWTEPGTLDV